MAISCGTYAERRRQFAFRAFCGLFVCYDSGGLRVGVYTVDLNGLILFVFGASDRLYVLDAHFLHLVGSDGREFPITRAQDQTAPLRARPVCAAVMDLPGRTSILRRSGLPSASRYIAHASWRPTVLRNRRESIVLRSRIADAAGICSAEFCHRHGVCLVDMRGICVLRHAKDVVERPFHSDGTGQSDVRGGQHRSRRRLMLDGAMGARVQQQVAVEVVSTLGIA